MKRRTLARSVQRRGRRDWVKAWTERRPTEGDCIDCIKNTRDPHGRGPDANGWEKLSPLEGFQ
jgi:hypothetical protein